MLDRHDKDPRRHSPESAEEPSKAWGIAMRALARREHSAQQVREMLAGRGVSEPVMDELLERLIRLGHLDDERFAMESVRTDVARRRGRLFARQRLEQAGVAAHLVERVIDGAYADELSLARAALGTRLACIDDRPGRARAARFLVGRGFSEAIIEEIAGGGPEDS